MKFKIGDLVVFQKPHMSSYEWRRANEPYLTAIVTELTRENGIDGGCGDFRFYNVYAANGQKYWDIREDRLAILAAVKD